MQSMGRLVEPSANSWCQLTSRVTYSNNHLQTPKENCACSVIWSTKGYRMEIIPEAFLEQNLFVRGHEMRDPDGREQCKWHLQMRSVHKGAEMQVGKPRE